MVRILSYGIEILSSLVFLIPTIVILQRIVFREYRFQKLVFEFLFAAYAIAVFTATGIPTIHTLRIDPEIWLIPLIDLFHSPWEYLRNTALNILLFVPMGFLTPMCWKEYRLRKNTLLLGLAVSVMIELLQLFTFRLTDLDDVITNTLGTYIGYRIAEGLAFRLPQNLSGSDENTPAGHEPVILFAAVLAVTFLFKPFVSDALWNIVLTSHLWESIR